MIRQQFYPKNQYNSRSLNKNKNHSFNNLNVQNKNPLFATPQRKKSVVQKSSSYNNFMQKLPSQEIDSSSRPMTIHNYRQMINVNNEQVNISESRKTNILKSNQNQMNKRIMNRLGTEINMKTLFITSNKKQLTPSRKQSYRNNNKSLGIQNNNSIFEDRDCIIHAKRLSVTSNTSRKIGTAEINSRSFRLSRSKNNMNEIGQFLIGNSTLIAIDKNSSRKLTPFMNTRLQQNTSNKQMNFNQITSNIINLNLSKAIKYRQQNNQKERKKKNPLVSSIKRSKQNLQNIQAQIEQKVKGWDIEIQDDICFY